MEHKSKREIVNDALILAVAVEVFIASALAFIVLASTAAVAPVVGLVLIVAGVGVFFYARAS